MIRYFLAFLILAGPALAQNNDWETFQMWREGCPNPDFPQNEEQRKFCEGFNYAMYYIERVPEIVTDLGSVNNGGIVLHPGNTGAIVGDSGTTLLVTPDVESTLETLQLQELAPNF